MIGFARLKIEERDPYFAETANRRGISQLIVEKDFWVCFTLRVLFNLEKLAEQFVFKGGTSLSKVFGVIERFSEDVDLSLSPAWLGFNGENSLENAPSKTKRMARLEKLDQACTDAVKNIIRPVLESAITGFIGPSPSQREYLRFEVDKQSKSPTIVFYYPTNQADAQGYIRPQVKLELGSLTDQHPTGTHEVTPWVAEEFPETFSEGSCKVVALEAERTFWEKATILHAEYHRSKESPMRNRFSRDCYDMVTLATHDSGKRALADLSLLERVANFKQTYFPAAWARYETARPGTLKLVPPKHRLDELKADYKAMQEMFYGKPPSFDELLEQLSQLERTINQKL